jgi:chromosome partitioning protein
MSATIIAFFNNKGGVGKTSLVYHLAWMYADLGIRVIAADLDPQANLTAAFLDEDRLEELWPDRDHRNTIFGCVQPLMRGIGDIAAPHLEYVDDPLALLGQLALLVGDLSLSGFEDELSAMWPECLDRKERAFRVISAFWRILQRASAIHKAAVILMDLGPNLGAINRTALIAADYVVVPLSPDLFSLQGLRNLGPTLRRWRAEWKERQMKNPVSDLELPLGSMLPVGYIVLQHSVRLDRPVKAYERWLARIPEVYRNDVLAKPGGGRSPSQKIHTV